MATGSAGFHEAESRLAPATVELHRAIVSLMEELEAIDWYQQRINASQDAELRAILQHNRDEEKEHAAMVLEWIRRRDPGFDRVLRAFLFAEGPIADREGQSGEDGPRTAGAGAAGPRVLVGSLRGGR